MKRCPGGRRGLDGRPRFPRRAVSDLRIHPWCGLGCSAGRSAVLRLSPPLPAHSLPMPGLLMPGAGIVSVTLTPPSPGTLRARRDPELSVSQEVAQPGLGPRLGVASEDSTRLSRAEARPSASKEVKEAGGNVLRAASRVGDRDAVMFTWNLRP